jgi:capsid portal protein
MTTEKRKKPAANVPADAALIARAFSGGNDVVEKQALQAMQDQTERWTTAGALTPRYPPAAMLGIVERSSILPQCLDAMANGIDGWGHRFVPALDLGADDIADQVRAAIVLEREAEAREEAQAEGDEDWEADYEVTDEEVAERVTTLERQMPIQKFRAEAWFKSAPSGGPFFELRRRMRRDQYAIGHGVLEFSRDDTGELSQVGYVPGHTLLPLAKAPEPVEVEVPIPVSPISTRTVVREVQFQIYVQEVGAQRRYFKELGDPRIVSQGTGKIYDSEGALKKEEGGRGKVAPITATEVLYLALTSPQSTAGDPPWSGQVPNVLGLRAAEEVNFGWFDDKCVPPGAWLIVGGMLHSDLKREMENHLRNKVRGRTNFYTPLIIELAAPTAPRGERVELPKVEWMSFRADIDKDATHQNYTQAARNSIRSSFRLPRALTGDLEDALARANAYASLEYANIHVFTTPRLVFDWIINSRVMPELGVPLWSYESLGPNTSDPESVARMADVFAERGGLVPADVRALAAQTLNLPLPPISASWTQQPMALSLAGLAADQLGVPADRVGEELLSAFGADASPERRTLAQGILKDFFSRCGYELVRVTPLDAEGQAPGSGGAGA